MSCSCNIPHPLKREGTYQWQRFPAGLKQGFYQPDDRTIEQLVMQAAEYASFVKYYDTTLNEWGRWKEFYDFIYDYQNKTLKFTNIDSLLQRGDVPPHLGLLLSFLKTFQTLRDSFNGFTGRHVDFYYEDVLQLAKKTAEPDKVAVLFEPEKNTVAARVAAGRELDAGKDAAKKSLVYKTTREIIVNQVTIAKKKTVFADKTGAITNGLYAAADAVSNNSFKQNNITSWRVFGSINNAPANVGFAFCSPLLLAKEGRRRLTIEIDSIENFPPVSLTASYTGPKGWVSKGVMVDLLPGVGSGTSAKTYLRVKIDESLPAIAAYDEKTHQSNYPTQYPVIKFLINSDANFPGAINFLSALTIDALGEIVMNVEGVKSYTITGDNGKLNPLQAFKPFGNTPVKNKSFFTIGSTEVFSKYLSTLHFAINWKGAPGNMAKYYSAYQTYLKTVPDNSVSPQTIDSFNKQWEALKQGNVPGKVELLSGGKWTQVNEDALANYINPDKKKSYNTFHTDNVINNDFDITESNDYTETSRWGFAKVTVGYDFGHQIFPNVLTYTVTNNAKVATAAAILPIPPQPYTPEFNSLHLDYVKKDAFDVAARPEHQLMQIHPFGFSIITSTQDTLVSGDYNVSGQLFIGLSNCPVAQTVNLYFSRLDGTEEIDALINEKTQWYYLTSNKWIQFGFDEIVVNTTTDFTESGFISFAIPEAALMPNTLMGESLVWIKVVSASSAAAYPSIIDINTNAVEAVFDDRDNDPYHLQTPLPAGTITKALVKIDGVKAVSQPSASYGGSMAEQAEHFFTRVSERLRHKNRSWSIWDYEHLVLEKFPAIYKIKCISHATQDCMYEPGNVLCVALPATVNIAEKDLLQPRISKGTLTEAEEYIGSFMTTFAHVKFINPVYEPIIVKCSVKINPGFDESFYRDQLNTDIQQFIAPWILNKNISPSFSGKIYASSIINFIEERPYINYLTNFEAFKIENNKTISWNEFATGSGEDVILTSHSSHQIDTQAIC
ncbi:baseplate J/gp47 family protein [Mucilaginibacter sp.]|jgi:hypothetical protein|uniref:baseplate J/gp47 family protein n=1 Tax=Mucilaginibacter sp. TaxID=1882438 RepID=UPI002BBAEAD2|nr:baseplate J/gp47 family protein [Mucilaginibacter sp.]HTI61057.1 baseplate J/gp47 family protein [Mucilaginibacter sp.]